jgi:hypothetical protein
MADPTTASGKSVHARGFFVAHRVADGVSRACTYCGSNVDDHDPVCLRQCGETDELVGRFCNYACLSTYIDEENLVAGDACERTPDE